MKNNYFTEIEAGFSKTNLSIFAKIGFQLSYFFNPLFLFSLVLFTLLTIVHPDSSWADDPVQVKYIPQPDIALATRIEMIRNAEKSIDIETFSLPTSESTGRIIVGELLKKADEAKKKGKPMKIRVLVDDYYYWRWDPTFPVAEYAAELKKRGIEFKLYNKVNLWKLGGANKRDHRKIMTIDGKETIIGGRNLGDAYYGLGANFNFDDTDFLIKTKNLDSLSSSFDSFWNSSLSREPEIDSVPESQYKKAEKATDPIEKQRLEADIASSEADAKNRAKWAKELLNLNDFDKKLLGKVEDVMNNKKRPATHLCPSVKFVSDLPADEWNDRHTQKYLLDRLSKAEKHILISNYIFLPMRGIKDFFEKMKSKYVDFDILTNDYSAYATEGESSLLGDTVARRVARYSNYYTFFLHNSRSTNIKWTDFGTDKDAILHHKNFVIDHSTVIGGSFNIHPRSEFADSEILAIFENCPELAKEVEAHVHSLMEKGNRYFTHQPNSFYCGFDKSNTAALVDVGDFLAAEIAAPLY